MREPGALACTQSVPTALALSFKLSTLRYH